MKHLVIVLITTTVILAVVIGLLIFERNKTTTSSETQTPILTETPSITEVSNNNQAEETNEPTISDWTPYYNTELSFQIIHPIDISPEENNEDGSVRITKLGPTQKEGTEFYDGFYLHFAKGNLGVNKDLNSLINADIKQKQEQLSGDFKIITPLSSITINNINGLTYQSQEIFGSYTYFYLPQGETRFILVTKHVSDPGNLGFEAIADKIINSINIL
jgi:hypothetical protein